MEITKKLNLEMSLAKNIIESEILDYIIKNNLKINNENDLEYLLENFISNYVLNNKKYIISFDINIKNNLLNVEFIIFEDKI